MQDRAAQPRSTPEMARLSREEQRSLTHGEFWIPEAERQVYKHALRTLNRAGVPYVVSGLYAIYEYTGIYRKTKDLDLFFQPEHVVPAVRALKAEGFTARLEDSHWLAKVFHNEKQIDLIFGMGNGLALIDAEWYRHSRPGILAAVPVRVAPPEELLFHRLYVSERHRHDMADALHLILCRGKELDWDRVLRRLQAHWRLLLAQVYLFDFAYPGQRACVPADVRERLSAAAAADDHGDGHPRVCQGTLISRFSFSIDVNEWGFRDLRKEAILATRALPIIREIVQSEVWEH